MDEDVSRIGIKKRLDSLLHTSKFSDCLSEYSFSVGIGILEFHSSL